MNYFNTNLDLPQEQIKTFFDWYYLDPEQLSQQRNFFIRKRTIKGITIWDVFPQDFQTQINLFSFFQVFFPENNEGNFDQIRIDSGCQIGQIYDDGGCDCRWQFIKAKKISTNFSKGIFKPSLSPYSGSKLWFF